MCTITPSDSEAKINTYFWKNYLLLKTIWGWSVKFFFKNIDFSILDKQKYGFLKLYFFQFLEPTMALSVLDHSSRLFILFFVVVVVAKHWCSTAKGLFLAFFWGVSRGGSAQCPLEWPVVIFLGLLNMVHLTLAKIDDYIPGEEEKLEAFAEWSSIIRTGAIQQGSLHNVIFFLWSSELYYFT